MFITLFLGPAARCATYSLSKSALFFEFDNAEHMFYHATIPMGGESR
jgi:hypothetical protein